jgi:hypothetical protein
VGIAPARECKKVSQKAGQTGINMAFPLQSDGFLSAICIQIVFKHTILTHCLLMLLRFFSDGISVFIITIVKENQCVFNPLFCPCSSRRCRRWPPLLTAPS